MKKIRNILCFGDSNTHGTPPMNSILDLDRFPPDRRWPGVLRGKLGDQVLIIEEGLPGRTTVFDNEAAGGGRSGLTALPSILESHRPLDLVAVMLGTNDLHTHLGVSAWVIANNMRQVIQKISSLPCGPQPEEPVQILLISPPPVKECGFAEPALVGAAEKSAKLAELYRALAKENGTEFLDAGSIVEVDPLDGVHLSLESHMKLGQAVAHKVAEMLALESK